MCAAYVSSWEEKEQWAPNRIIYKIYISSQHNKTHQNNRVFQPREKKIIAVQN